jgi:hypothetical protein
MRSAPTYQYDFNFSKARTRFPFPPSLLPPVSPPASRARNRPSAPSAGRDAVSTSHAIRASLACGPGCPARAQRAQVARLPAFVRLGLEQRLKELGRIALALDRDAQAWRCAGANSANWRAPADDAAVPLLQRAARPGVERRQLHGTLRFGNVAPAALQQPALHRQQPGARMRLCKRVAHRRPHLAALRDPAPARRAARRRCRGRTARSPAGSRRTARPSRAPGRARRPARAGRPAIRPAARTPCASAAAPRAAAAAPPAPGARTYSRVGERARRRRTPAPRQVGLELREARLDDRGEARLPRSCRHRAPAPPLDRRRRHAMRQAHAAFGLADVERQAVECRGPLQRQRKQRVRLAGLQFELDLADRLGRSPARTSPTSSATSICAPPGP